MLQLGGGECAGVSQVKIGSSFFEAAHERNYRDALKFQRKFEDSVKCAEEIARLIGQGVSELLGGKKIRGFDGAGGRVDPGTAYQAALISAIGKIRTGFRASSGRAE